MGSHAGALCASSVKQCLELALAVKTGQVIEAADMHLANKYLWDSSALGSLHHFRQVQG